MGGYVYVASSWRNQYQEFVVRAIRDNGIGAYDFKRDEGAQFHWSEAGLSSSTSCTFADYQASMQHPRARAGFASDFGAMCRATAFVLVLPCGRSSHLELGWAAGRRIPTAVLFDNADDVLPELMYGLCDFRTDNLAQLLAWLRRIDAYRALTSRERMSKAHQN